MSNKFYWYWAFLRNDRIKVRKRFRKGAHTLEHFSSCDSFSVPHFLKIFILKILFREYMLCWCCFVSISWALLKGEGCRLLHEPNFLALISNSWNFICIEKCANTSITFPVIIIREVLCRYLIFYDKYQFIEFILAPCLIQIQN